jgi:imidazolonepropionase-like amidohydrolase
MADDEVAAVCEIARRNGRRVAAHARGAESVKECLRHGVGVTYHASFADQEARDMLAAQKARSFVAPISSSSSAAARIMTDECLSHGFACDSIACTPLSASA